MEGEEKEGGFLKVCTIDFPQLVEYLNKIIFFIKINCFCPSIKYWIKKIWREPAAKGPEWERGGEGRKVRAKAQYGVQWVIIMILYNCLLYDCLWLLVINHILSPLSTTLDWLFLFAFVSALPSCSFYSTSLSLPLSLSLCVPFLLSHVTCNCSWIGRKTTGSAAAPGRFWQRFVAAVGSPHKVIGSNSRVRFGYVSF